MRLFCIDHLLEIIYLLKESSSLIDAWSFDENSDIQATDDKTIFSSPKDSFDTSTAVRNSVCEVLQQYVTPCNPNGCIIKIEINSTWGDQYYVVKFTVQLKTDLFLSLVNI